MDWKMVEDSKERERERDRLHKRLERESLCVSRMGDVTAVP